MAHSPNRSRQALAELPLFHRFIATGFFSGYVPIAPGTAGSVVALLFFCLPGFGRPVVLVPVTIVVFVIGAMSAHAAERLLGQDPAAVTIDEVAGMWLSLWFLPLTPQTMLAAFALFRCFDIFKPFPVSYFDRKRGGWNIMLDDAAAALYTNLLLQILHRFNLL